MNFASMTDDQLREHLRDLISKGTVSNWNGHFRGGHEFQRQPDFVPTMLEYNAGSWMWGNTKPFESIRKEEFPVELNSPSCLLKCDFCGEHLGVYFDGQGISLSTKDGAECKHPEGIKAEFELNVPSGKLVIDADLDLFPIDRDYDTRTVHGQVMLTLEYVKIGLAHSNVSDGFDVFLKDGVYTVSKHQEEYWDHVSKSYKPNEDPNPFGVEVVSLDRWYSFCDLEEYQRRIKHYGFDPGDIKTIDVAPGVYRFVHDKTVCLDDQDVAVVQFEKVREPDPVVDYLGAEKSKSFTAMEILIHLAMTSYSFRSHHKDWDDMTQDEKMMMLLAVTDSIFLVGGSGIEWHENGFPRSTPSDRARKIAAEEFGNRIPAFEGRHHWYPFWDSCSLMKAAGLSPREGDLFLTPDFVLLAHNVCQNFLRFGEETEIIRDTNPAIYNLEPIRERMHMMASAYRELRIKYPDVVFDAEFDAWFHTTDMKGYIEKFDFKVPKHKRRRVKSVKTGEYCIINPTKLSSSSGLRQLATRENKRAKGTGYYTPLNNMAVGRVLAGNGPELIDMCLIVEIEGAQFMLMESDMDAVEQFDGEFRFEKLLKKIKSGKVKPEILKVKMWSPKVEYDFVFDEEKSQPVPTNPKYVIPIDVHYQGLNQIRSIGQKLTIDSQHPELGAFVERIEFQGWSRTSKKMEFVVSADGKFYKARITSDAQGKFTTHPWKKIRKSEAEKFEDRYEI